MSRAKTGPDRERCLELIDSIARFNRREELVDAMLEFTAQEVMKHCEGWCGQKRCNHTERAAELRDQISDAGRGK